MSLDSPLNSCSLRAAVSFSCCKFSASAIFPSSSRKTSSIFCERERTFFSRQLKSIFGASFLWIAHQRAVWWWWCGREPRWCAVAHSPGLSFYSQLSLSLFALSQYTFITFSNYQKNPEIPIFEQKNKKPQRKKSRVGVLEKESEVAKHTHRDLYWSIRAATFSLKEKN